MSLQQSQFNNNARISMEDRGFDLTRGTHGTAFDDRFGDVIRPGGDVGRNNFPEFSRSNRTYFSAHSKPERIEKSMDLNLLPSEEDYVTSEDKWNDDGPHAARAKRSERMATAAIDGGWHWASLAKSDDTHVITGQPVRPRPIVHEVQPIGHVDEDPVMNSGGRSGIEMTADALQVTDTHWIKPPGWGGEC